MKNNDTCLTIQDLYGYTGDIPNALIDASTVQVVTSNGHALGTAILEGVTTAHDFPLCIRSNETILTTVFMVVINNRIHIMAIGRPGTIKDITLAAEGIVCVANYVAERIVPQGTITNVVLSTTLRV